MAARRVSKSAVDWAAFYERVPNSQKEAYRALKAKSDQFVTRVHQYPEELPKIDWAYYKTRVSQPGVVENFEKAYAGAVVPYPKDKDNILAKIDVQQQEAQVKSKAFVEECKANMKESKMMLEKLAKLPRAQDMTIEMMWDYFPESRVMQSDRPSLWPHNKKFAPEKLELNASTNWGAKIFSMLKPAK